MAAKITRLEFKLQYNQYKQGLFLLFEEKRLPKGQAVVNLGKALSEKLSAIPRANRQQALPLLLSDVMQPYSVVSVTHIDVLFTDYLEVDVLRALLALCRNRKICAVWPGQYIDGRFIYATPDRLEYYECDPSDFQDTYIVVEEKRQ